jgi:hypothetical protein
MKPPWLLAIALFGYTILLADSAAPDRQYIATSPSSRCYFVMLPSRPTAVGSDSTEDGGSGIAYRLMRDGSVQEMWRTKGWYSTKVFLAEDCRHLVRLNAVIEGNCISENDVAVAFYDRGVLIKSYSTKDLVLDPTKISKSVSYYKWLSRDVVKDKNVMVGGHAFEAEPEPELNFQNKFLLKTAEGIAFIFDVTDGSILSRQ